MARWGAVKVGSGGVAYEGAGGVSMTALVGMPSGDCTVIGEKKGLAVLLMMVGCFVDGAEPQLLSGGATSGISLPMSSSAWVRSG